MQETVKTIVNSKYLLNLVIGHLKTRKNRGGKIQEIFQKFRRNSGDSPKIQENSGDLQNSGDITTMYDH